MSQWNRPVFPSTSFVVAKQTNKQTNKKNQTVVLGLEWGVVTMDSLDSLVLEVVGWGELSLLAECFMYREMCWNIWG